MAREEADYFQRIEEHFGQRRGGPLILSPKDWQLVQRWYQKNIPLAVVLRGINQAFDRFTASGPRPDRLNTLSYCAQHVETIWEEHRRTHAGSQEGRDEGPSTKPSPEILHLREISLVCHRAASEESPGNVSRCLEHAAAELEVLAARWEAGELDAGSLDAAAKALERRVEETLALAWKDVQGKPSRPLADMRIPHFSPYAI